MRRLRDLVVLAVLVLGAVLVNPTGVEAGPDDTLFNIPDVHRETSAARIHQDSSSGRSALSLLHYLRFLRGVTFNTLNQLQINGVMAYCSDCTIANPCAAGGTGALAKRLNGVWVCN